MRAKGMGKGMRAQAGSRRLWRKARIPRDLARRRTAMRWGSRCPMRRRRRHKAPVATFFLGKLLRRRYWLKNFFCLSLTLQVCISHSLTLTHTPVPYLWGYASNLILRHLIYLSFKYSGSFSCKIILVSNNWSRIYISSKQNCLNIYITASDHF